MSGVSVQVEMPKLNCRTNYETANSSNQTMQALARYMQSMLYPTFYTNEHTILSNSWILILIHSLK
jgi:hypothetical protein